MPETSQNSWNNLSNEEKIDFLEANPRELTLEKVLEVGYPYTLNNLHTHLRGGRYENMPKVILQKTGREITGNPEEHSPRWLNNSIGIIETDIHEVIIKTHSVNSDLADKLENLDAKIAKSLVGELLFNEKLDEISPEAKDCVEGLIYLYKELRGLGYTHQELTG